MTNESRIEKIVFNIVARAVNANNRQWMGAATVKDTEESIGSAIFDGSKELTQLLTPSRMEWAGTEVHEEIFHESDLPETGDSYVIAQEFMKAIDRGYVDLNYKERDGEYVRKLETTRYYISKEKHTPKTDSREDKVLDFLKTFKDGVYHDIDGNAIVVKDSTIGFVDKDKFQSKEIK